VALVAALLPLGPVQAQAGCRFVLGFATLRDLVGPAAVGDCLEDERFDPANGNVEQQTSGGLLVWRKSDKWTAFTDGYRTWVNGPFGLQERLNTERFDWETDPAPTSGSAAPTPSTGTVTVSPAAQPAVDAVVRAAAAHLGISADHVRVELVEERQWRDSSLGCPQPGFFYSQVITPGYLVVVSGAGKRLEYHTDTQGRAVLCAEQ
jgi:hypothetical protein